MDDIRRQDMRLFLKELLSPWRIILTCAILLVLLPAGSLSPPIAFIGSFLTLLVTGVTAWFESEKNRFLNKRMKALWMGCQDRMARFDEVIKKLRKEQIADFEEMPATIRSVSQSLYCALRRADLISHEVQQSERDLYGQTPVWKQDGHDPQSEELYRLADRNIEEYRVQFAGVMAGVQRTEAQSAVFMTTLDTLRMKMIGYRLVGRSPELPSHDFMEALAEAKTQLQSIDTALEELDLGHYPKTIAVVPPAVQEDAHEKLEQSGS